MKIAINCSYFSSTGGGIKEYVINLVTHLNSILPDKDTLICYIPRDQEGYWKKVMPSNIFYKCTPYTTKQPIRRSLFQQLFWKKEENIEKFDLFHSPFFYAPKFKSARIIITIHDLRFMKYPDSYTFLRCKYLKYIVPKRLKIADAILTISEFTKSEAVKYFGIDPDKIKVIHEAVNLQNFKIENAVYTDRLKQLSIQPKKFILSVGHIEPRKNYERLITAFEKLSQLETSNLKLVIVGKKNYKYNSTLKLIAESKHTIHLGWVSFEELLWLYANCYFHIFPSIYEGFGFPTLEAAAFGKVTLGANASSIPEIARDGAIFFDPFSAEDIQDKISYAINNPDILKAISEKALKNLDHFNWKNNAEETYKMYLKTCCQNG